MCDPITIAATTTAISAASAVVGYIGQNQAADANEAAANVNYNSRMEALNAEGVQTDAKASEDALTSSIERAQTYGRIVTSISEMGGSQLSLSKAVQGAAFAGAREQSLTDLNFRNRREQIAREKIGAGVEKTNMINAVPRSSPISLALKLGSAAVGGYKDFKDAGDGNTQKQ